MLPTQSVLFITETVYRRNWKLQIFCCWCKNNRSSNKIRNKQCKKASAEIYCAPSKQ